MRRGDGSAGWGEARVSVRGQADEGVWSGRVREGERPGASWGALRSGSGSMQVGMGRAGTDVRGVALDSCTGAEDK